MIYHHATHIGDSLALLVDAPHLPDAVAIAGRVLGGIHLNQLNCNIVTLSHCHIVTLSFLMQSACWAIALLHSVSLI